MNQTLSGVLPLVLPVWLRHEPVTELTDPHLFSKTVLAAWLNACIYIYKYVYIIYICTNIYIIYIYLMYIYMYKYIYNIYNIYIYIYILSSGKLIRFCEMGDINQEIEIFKLGVLTKKTVF